MSRRLALTCRLLTLCWGALWLLGLGSARVEAQEHAPAGQHAPASEHAPAGGQHAPAAGGDPAAAEEHAAGGAHGEHAGHGSRAGDASLFMELFSHLQPHAVGGLWLGGEKRLGLVDVHLYDEARQPILDAHGAPASYASSADLTEARQAEFGGGRGVVIYNINTVMWLAGIALLLALLPVAAKARARSGQAPRGAYHGLMESLVLFVRDEMVYAVLGKEAGRRLLPLFLTQFFFILFLNLFGLMPLGPLGGTATANLAVTGALALTTLLWIHMGGIREHGFVHHWQNFIPHGLPWFVLPIIVPVEILGMLVKPAALTIRLFANLTAGHLIMLGLFGLVYYFDSFVIATPVLGMSIAIECLELFVCFVQAYIFTYLSIVFVGASLHPEH